jgi:adenosylhomocysteine nucleosidase
MRILFVASDRMEFPGLLRHATAVRPTELAADWSRRALLNGNEALLVANGVGPARAAAATEAGIGAYEPDAIVSTGFCGALSPGLGIADLVTANRIVTGGQIYDAHSLKGPLCGPIRSISFVARTAQEKRELASEGAIAVEMEAAGVAAEALRHSIPFYCIRAVTDLAGESLANDFNKALRSDGHFDTMSILRVALLHPATRLPELIRLRKRCVLAARALGDFFANNRF